MHEYDPLLQQKDTVKYRIKSLNDPTKRDMYKTLKAGAVSNSHTHTHTQHVFTLNLRL